MATEKRLIDANDALERLQKAEQEMKVVSIVGYKAVPMDGVIEFIQTRPTVDAVEVVHGRWKPYHEADIGYDEYGVRCSKCGLEVEDHEVKFIMHYCPNCGAKMDGERKDNG